jgi:hypothetical protein
VRNPSNSLRFEEQGLTAPIILSGEMLVKLVWVKSKYVLLMVEAITGIELKGLSL